MYTKEEVTDKFYGPVLENNIGWLLELLLTITAVSGWNNWFLRKRRVIIYQINLNLQPI